MGSHSCQYQATYLTSQGKLCIPFNENKAIDKYIPKSPKAKLTFYSTREVELDEPNPRTLLLHLPSRVV